MCATGWWDIGYNFLIGEDGKVYDGRGWNTVGAHVYGYNSRSIGIALIGNFDSRIPNSAALNACKKLIGCGVSKVTYRIDFLACTTIMFLFIDNKSTGSRG